MTSTSNLLDIFTKLITALECPVCYEYVSSPIYQCNSGHILCNKCISSIYICPTCRCSISPSSSRVRSIEHISDFMIFPCRNEGCEEILPLKELQNHENRCRHANAFGGTMNENYKHTSLKHKLFVHVEQHIAPFFVTCPSVANIDVGIQTECETRLTAEASTSTDFSSQNVGPYLMYGIMQSAEQILKPNEVLPHSSQQFCGFVSPSNTLINGNFDPKSIVNNFTEMVKKNTHLFNLPSNDSGISTSTNLFGTSSSSSGRIAEDSQSVDVLNLNTDLHKVSRALVTQGANISVQNPVSFSSLEGVKQSPLLSFPVRNFGNNSSFSTDSMKTSLNLPSQIKMSSGPAKSNILMKTDFPKKEFTSPKSLSPFNKIDSKLKSQNNHFKSLRVEHDKYGSSDKSYRKKIFPNRTTNNCTKRFSLGYCEEPSKAHGFNKKQNAFCFSGMGNSTTISKQSPSTFSFHVAATSSNSEQTVQPKELTVHNSGTSTIAARSCATSVTFSLNSSISCPSASTSEIIPNNPLHHSPNPTVSCVTSQSSCNTSNSQPAVSFIDKNNTALHSKTSFIFGDNSSISSPKPSFFAAPKIPVVHNSSPVVSNSLSSASMVGTNTSSLLNLCRTAPPNLQSNSTSFPVAPTSFNPIATAANFDIPSSTTPVSTSKSIIIKDPIDSEACANTSVEFPGFKQNLKNPIMSLESFIPSSTSINFSSSSQINNPCTSSKNSDSDTKSPLFSDFLKQFNKRSKNVQGFNFSLSTFTNDSLSSGIQNFSFSKRTNTTVTPGDIFLFGKN